MTVICAENQISQSERKKGALKCMASSAMRDARRVRGKHKRRAEFTRVTVTVQILSNPNPIESRAQQRFCRSFLSPIEVLRIARLPFTPPSSFNIDEIRSELTFIDLSMGICLAVTLPGVTFEHAKKKKREEK